MIIPEPMPLPKPISSDASSSVIALCVNGVSIIATPMMSIDGTATQARPRRSITLPAG
jgi:hypothetical protein